jgi:hypothetical protein
MIMRLAAGTLMCTIALFSVARGQKVEQKRPQPSVDEIIQRFAGAESENRIARNNYTFTQEFDLKTIGPANNVTGQFHRVSDIVFDDRGERVERITNFPPSTLVELTVTPEDMRDLAGVQPFALTKEELPKYDIAYFGKEHVDELDTYVFDVKPKRIVNGERYFQGRIWVDDRDLQIVKAAGQAVPEVKDQRFPHFETYRENIDGRYWFPTYIFADDVLQFKNNAVHIRMSVRYSSYKKFSTRIRMADEGEAVPDAAKDKSDAGRPTLKRPDKP